jgi:hypothetical protein
LEFSTLFEEREREALTKKDLHGGERGEQSRMMASRVLSPKFKKSC